MVTFQSTSDDLLETMPSLRDDEPQTRDRIHQLDLRLQSTEENRVRDHAQNVEHLDRIEKLATDTNGRVTALEQWRWMIVGALAILTALLTPVVIWLMQLAVKRIVP